MEKYGIPDSLDYEKVSNCWGHFAESDESNQIFLDSCLGNGFRNGLPGERHTGSTFFVSDLNGNGAKDLVLGDVDYPGLVMLTNGGSSMDAMMISQDWGFPFETKEINLFSMPAVAFLDVNNDNKRDLLVSPFDPNPYVSRNHQSSQLYLNDGEDDLPDFRFEKSIFLQEEMIDLGSGAYPALLDVNGDGLKDLVVGNYGYYDSSWYDEWFFLHSSYTASLALFLNTGTLTQPSYNFYNPDFAGLSELGVRELVPTFADLDGDGDFDMLCGNENGKIMYFENVAASMDTVIFQLKELNYQGIDVGDFSYPHLFDIDRDQLPDLIIGEKKGNLNYYRNTGSVQQPLFTFVTDSLGGVQVTDYSVSNNGYSCPRFFRVQDETRLIVGSEQGKLFYFKDVDENLPGKFPESDSLAFLVDTSGVDFFPAFRSSAVIDDINGDGWMDIFAGNFSGGIQLYSKTHVPVSPWIEENQADVSLILYPNPAGAYVSLKAGANVKSMIVRMYDMNGSLVREFTVNKNYKELYLQDLSPGIYLLRTRLFLQDQSISIRSDKLLIR
ncbi:MAG: T9SS type A sorting domain-containing protein [Bacteroidota bacterium]|nr:T9SS type A sorting domain-containing protein [Bacteroidota bacterium]